MIEAEIEAEEDENASGDGFCEAAVEIHGLVDPVAVAEVPEEAAEITEDGSLTKSKWVVVLIVGENCPNQGKECDPAEGGSPERDRPRDGKGQNLKNAGENGHGPKSRGDKSHRV